ncbi:MAG TPA: hypothetical protein VMM15_26345, partial [Bradyrhizobium sp.]|nr:hypothetical protein [Bradyrhizobium sp.]
MASGWREVDHLPLASPFPVLNQGIVSFSRRFPLFYGPMPTQKPVIAVLDDESELRKALRRLLTGRGFCVEEYESGSDFLAALDSQPPDCLLL